MLPQDLVVRLLSMLPVVSLLRFRCACKAWCELIDDPSFITKHLNHATFSKNECIILKRFIEQRSKNVLSFVSEETLDVISTDIDVPFFDHQYVQLLGTCNGIICLAYEGDIVLCNPATREFKALPPCINDYLPGLMHSELGLGFGFDGKSNDYKVVRIFNLYYEGPLDAYCPVAVKADIYNLSTDSWRKLDSVPNVLFEYCFQPLLNGAFHWGVLHEKEDPYVSILSFHLSSEVFEEIPYPDIYSYPDDKSKSVGVLNNEYLALILYMDSHADKYFDIWVMKEYGVKESWTKQFTLGPVLGIISPLSVGKYNELLLRADNGQLVFCDIDTNKIRDLEVHTAPKTLQVVVMYIRSLVSMKRLIKVG
ncbi:hypothetical protein LguiB_019537 [Lonicera macranthoides]